MNLPLEMLNIRVVFECKTAAEDISVGDKIDITYNDYSGKTARTSYGVSIFAGGPDVTDKLNQFEISTDRYVSNLLRYNENGRTD